MEKHKSVKGYMTVEASFLIPLVLFLYMNLILLSFYLYDRTVLEADAYRLCYEESISKTEGKGSAQGKEGALSETGYLALESRALSVSEEGRWFYGAGEMKAAGWNATCRTAAKRYDPPRSIRRVRRVLHLAEALLGEDE